MTSCLFFSFSCSSPSSFLMNAQIHFEGHTGNYYSYHLDRGWGGMASDNFNLCHFLSAVLFDFSSWCMCGCFVI
jgi:hypothetical protein